MISSEILFQLANNAWRNFLRKCKQLRPLRPAQLIPLPSLLPNKKKRYQTSLSQMKRIKEKPLHKIKSILPKSRNWKTNLELVKRRRKRYLNNCQMLKLS